MTMGRCVTCDTIITTLRERKVDKVVHLVREAQWIHLVDGQNDHPAVPKEKKR